MRLSKNIKMHILMLLLALTGAGSASALNLEAGDYCFDNSKLKFSQVKMIVGNVNRQFTRVYDMSQVSGRQWWRVILDENLKNLSYFTFAETDVPAGTYDVRLNVFLDSLKTASGNTLRRTNLNSKADIDHNDSPTWIYYPFNDDALSNGYWRPEYSYDATISGTLPVVYLNTQDSATIVSKHYYINGTLWIEDETQALGSADEPLTIEVKGRGNWTWYNSYKKPYKVKFNSKQSPLGLDKSRHFILMAHSEDFSGYLRNTTGFEISKLLDMPYSPTELPVELVLNGEYMGLYFLCEKIRVEGGRVEIIEQDDNETNAYSATGGWLLELTDDGNVVIAQHQNNDPNNPFFSFITQSPEELSQVQRNYIHDLLASADSCVYVTNKNDQGWEEILDIHSLARFYVIHEVMENVEAFSGSLFMYKDRGWDEKLMFGPVWDFDNSFYHENTTSDHFIFDYDSPYPFLWIKEILKYPRFQQEIREVWHEFCCKRVLDKIIDHAWQWREMVVDAEQQDRLRWHFYASTHGPDAPAKYLNVIEKKAAWLNSQWGIGADIDMDGTVTSADIIALYDYLMRGDTRYRYSADADGDGTVTVSDLCLIYKYLLGD
ncbi:MAG: CotH kinase family protein [Muribaculaceae bacterium]|nr:CotH kinase family protein [Muribaculaceae bacterium]